MRTSSAARQAFEVKRQDLRQNHLSSPGRKPSVADYVTAYFEKAKVRRKRPGTAEKERQTVERSRDHLGHLDKRLKGGIFCGRKLQPVFRANSEARPDDASQLLKTAMDDGHPRELPRMKMLDEAPLPKRSCSPCIPPSF